MRHRALLVLIAFTILLATLVGTDLDITPAEAAHSAKLVGQDESRYVAADPLPTYTFVPPPAIAWLKLVRR